MLACLDKAVKKASAFWVYWYFIHTSSLTPSKAKIKFVIGIISHAELRPDLNIAKAALALITLRLLSPVLCQIPFDRVTPVPTSKFSALL